MFNVKLALFGANKMQFNVHFSWAGDMQTFIHIL